MEDCINIYRYADIAGILVLYEHLLTVVSQPHCQDMRINKTMKVDLVLDVIG